MRWPWSSRQRGSVPDLACPECGCLDVVVFGVVMRVGGDGEARKAGVTGRCARCLVEVVMSGSGARVAPKARAKAPLESEEEREAGERLAAAHRHRVVGDADMPWEGHRSRRP